MGDPDWLSMGDPGWLCFPDPGGSLLRRTPALPLIESETGTYDVSLVLRE
jgi:hypothetical protein